ncbi:MAG TPA: ANTAR domain-containing protein [Microlunatus sp.]|nr:ANTAR domain-containing protein [Microlunatus sp.]
MTLRQDLTVLDTDNVFEADEQLVAPFSGRLDHRLGRFLGRPHADRWVWDREVLGILGCPAAETSTSLQTLLQHVAPDERELAAEAFLAAVEQSRPVVLSCRLYSGDGRFRSVLIAAEVTRTEPAGLAMADLLEVDGLSAADGPWLVGHLIDLTAFHLSATRAVTDHAVAEATRHRAVIEQAKGIVMLAYQVDADVAFQVLRRHSQNTNTKLRDLAARLVDAVQGMDLDAAPARIDALLSRRTLPE